MNDPLVIVLNAVTARGRGQIPTALDIARDTNLSREQVNAMFARAAYLGYGDHIEQEPGAFNLNEAGRIFLEQFAQFK